MSSSSAAQSRSWSNLEPPQHLCNCNSPQPSLWNTSHSDHNPERRYWYCRRRERWGDCDFWLWSDPDLNTHYKDVIQKLKLEKELAVEQVLRERKGKKNDEEAEPQADSIEDLKELVKNMKTIEGRIKGLYLLFVFVGLLLLFIRRMMSVVDVLVVVIALGSLL